MQTINIVSYIGSRCLTAADGQKLYDLMEPIVRAGEEVTLDFSEVKMFSSPFFNYSIGQIFTNHREDVLDKILHISGISDVGNMIVRKVVANSLAFRNSDSLKETLEKILAQQNGE